jgi:hypothetical protein
MHHLVLINMHSTAPARRLATRLQMRERRDQYDTDDDREHKPL